MQPSQKSCTRNPSSRYSINSGETSLLLHRYGSGRVALHTHVPVSQAQHPRWLEQEHRNGGEGRERLGRNMALSGGQWEPLKGFGPGVDDGTELTAWRADCRRDWVGGTEAGAEWRVGDGGNGQD